MRAVVELHDVTRSYGSPPVQALRGVSLRIEEGEFVAIVGPSGSGKSTLLNILGSLDRPTTGRAVIDGQDVAALGDDRLAALRAHRLGFVFQQFHLADGRSARHNVADGLLYQGVPGSVRIARAEEALTAVGLGHRLDNKPHQLSGGERQRVAIARAIVGDPALLLADEPTGNLDSRSGTGIVELLHELNTGGATVIVITHDESLAERLPRRIRVRDGLVVDDTGAPSAPSPAGSSAGSPAGSSAGSEHPGVVA
ncbi:putative ABC transport system ATP-binding protein [Microbacterium resistens]|uniref:ABC transport system ATP-binding protein n=1 Tax=Microbacterium resistens TaxID=156977 RepID=A0ABU1SEI6_9MICO|nr:ABC transporter ATP-binding protein [Microbacterium resistens]MDR6868018.1 putative ABC transport system ATP-binding protein [Microbacterium resistens]